jgi:hypothetical protein
MRKSVFARSLMLSVLGAASLVQAAPASLELKFLEPEKYRDAGEFDKDRERVREGLGAYLKTLVEKRLQAGQQLQVEVLDIDLAGELELSSRFPDRLRVMRSVTWPCIEFRYSLRSGDQVLRQATVSLRDMSYLDRINMHVDGDFLRYEKTMLDDWFRKEFVAELKP